MLKHLVVLNSWFCARLSLGWYFLEYIERKRNIGGYKYWQFYTYIKI